MSQRAFEVTQCRDGIYRGCYCGVNLTMILTERLFRDLEEGALEQLEQALHLPGLERVILTPDVHTGYAVPIGFTAVSPTHLYPDTVGPDPACSVSLSKITTSGFDRLDKPSRRAIIDELEETISVTRRRGRGRVTYRHVPLDFDELMEIVSGMRRAPRTWVSAHPPLYATATGIFGEFEELMRTLVTRRLLEQIGSIGGGNHFLEVQVGEDGALYVMAHFGSRGLGAVGSEMFFELVREDLSERSGRAWGWDELLFVPADTRLGKLYFMFQQAMLEYTTFNHLKVQDAASRVLCKHLGVETYEFLGHIPHNFIERRGGRFWQRKGATPAYDNQGIPLLIPGSMSTLSYVLEPGPNAHLYGESVPHGAGRLLSRSQAKRELDQKIVDRQFDRQGVMGSFRHVPLDESYAAYKDVDEVIQAVVEPGIARVVGRLRPVLVLKGE
ncbi:MAG: RtcB family protein [Trueperaceae bacterium]|nr:MAG: RtcB family protein [Trueperaceae bacterium]